MGTLKSFNHTYQFKNFYFAHASDSNIKRDDYYRHNHSRYELYVFFDGDTDFVLEDRVYQMHPDTILLISPHTYHYAAIRDSDHPYKRLVINFERLFIYPELHSLLDAGNNPFYWDEAKFSPLLADVERSLSVYEQSDAALLIQLFLNRLLMELKYSQKSLASSRMLNPTITQILTCINEHIHEPLSLKILADYTFLNPSYLSQIFASYMKIGLMDYVKQKKIYLAEEMIRDEKITPTEASKRLGFSDYSTFYRLYKKYLKDTPSAKHG